MDRLNSGEAWTKLIQVLAAGPTLTKPWPLPAYHVGNGDNFPFHVAPGSRCAGARHCRRRTEPEAFNRRPRGFADQETCRFQRQQYARDDRHRHRFVCRIYFTQAAEVVGLQIGKDVILKNMPPGEQILMAKGIGAVVPWEPSVISLRIARPAVRSIRSFPTTSTKAIYTFDRN